MPQLTILPRCLWQRSVAGVIAFVLIACGGACGGEGGGQPDAGPEVDAAPDGRDGPPSNACDPGPSGLACLFDLWDGRDGCDEAWVAAFRESIDRRHGELPAWHDGKALFVTRGASASVAGDLNDWQTNDLVTQRVCGTDLYAVQAAVASGRYAYKLVYGSTWRLDPENFAFAYDDFTGNADGRNSILNSYDSGRGHLVRPDEDLCSDVLGNCRPFSTYLPPGYGAPENAATRYPVLFMHDGQNIFDDHDCCFGHTGWEVNVTLDRMIAEQTLEPVVVVGFDHAGTGRAAEYAYERRTQFMEFQVTKVQPRAFELWRLDPARTYVAGSSFGGHISVLLAFHYPDLYVGAASLSGAFWPYEGTSQSIFAETGAIGKVPVAIYMDHGGNATDGGDGYWPNLTMRDHLLGLGWQEQTGAACDAHDNAVCYVYEADALHNELEWKDRAPLFLSFFFAR
jgi:predicted alpha/beta superfamily hydrolase